MRKIILQLAISADGYIEGPNGEYDWCFVEEEEDYGMNAFLTGIDTLLMGRKTYDVMQSADEKYFTDKHWIVVSKTLKAISEGEIYDTDIISKVKRLKAAPGKDIWLFGGAELAKLLLEYHLIDGIEMAVHPILLGNGKPLFSGMQLRTPLRLVESIPYASGLVMMKYAVLKK